MKKKNLRSEKKANNEKELNENILNNMMGT